jgi:hypothetical protein
MDDSSQHGDNKTPKYSAPKDKNCPYCGQAFTSSSLGRHLDLYIREKNPKPPDGIHNVEEIKKSRGHITRRQPRASLGGRREVSTPAGTPRGAARKDSVSLESSYSSGGAIPKDGQYAVDSTTLSKYPFPAPRWESTGVMNDIDEASLEAGKRPSLPRTASRQMIQKGQFDAKHKLSDAMDTARAAELALRELVSSWRAAKQQFDANSMPFDFDPLSLDFPALTLQCLKPPPTLFSSTQHPTSTSWSIQPPGQREFNALQVHFQEHFHKWKIACVTATTDAVEELTYPPNGTYRDKREIVKKAEKSAESLERQVNEHLQSAYTVWEKLPPQRQNELWVLELARGVGRRYKESETLKEKHHKLEQENANLKSQIEQLNRLQQPREFKILTPTTIPFDKDFIANTYELGLKASPVVGFSIQDRHSDLSTVVTRSIERWKNVIISSRIATAGMGAQKSLDQSNGDQGLNGTSVPQSRSQSHTPQQQTQPHQPPKRQSTASTNGLMSEHVTTSTNTTAPPSVEETSDQDADAEMEDDDSFAMMNTSPTKHPIPPPPMQQQATLEVPRTRAPMQHQRSIPDQHFLMQNGTANSVNRAAALSLSRSMPNINMAMQSNAMHAGDMGMALQGMQGDQMYME